MFTAFLLTSICLASPQVATPGTVSLINPRFIDTEGNQTSISGTSVLPARVPGDLIAEFDFQSALIDAATGYHKAPSISVMWSIIGPDDKAIVALPDGAWYGLTSPVPDCLLESFDRVTGIGRARLSLPVGREVPEIMRYPELPETQARIEIALGWRGAMSLDATGQPIGHQWRASVTTQTDVPAKWIEVTSPRAKMFEQVLAGFYLKTPATAKRTFSISAIPAEKVELPVARFSLDVGDQGFTFVYVPRDLGNFRLQVSEVGGTRTSSIGLTAVEPELVYEQFFGLVDAGVGPAGAPGGLPPAPEYGDWKDCKPAQGPTPGTIKVVCGNCTTGTPTANCPSTVYEMQPAYCFFKIFAECYMAPDAPITSPAFSFDKSDIVSCGSVGGSISGKIKGWLTLGLSGSKTMTKLCCTYKQNPALPPQTVNWPDCL